MILLKIDYCKECGDCCFSDCKSDDCICHALIRPEICDSYPIIKSCNEYWLGECTGIIKGKVDKNALEKIISRLKSGEKNFELYNEDLGIYFKAYLN